MDHTAIVRVLYVAGQQETDVLGTMVPLSSLTIDQVDSRQESLSHRTHIERVYAQAVSNILELSRTVGIDTFRHDWTQPLPVRVDWRTVMASPGELLRALQ